MPGKHFTAMGSIINLSSLTSSSGMDWDSVIDQLIELEKVPITKLETEKSANTEKNDLLAYMGTLMSSLKTASTALSSDGLFNSRLASSTTTNSTWGVTADKGTATGAYTVAITQLAKSAVRNGSSDIGYGLSQTSDVSGVTLATMVTAVKPTAGTFTVNGEKVTIALTDSLEDVFTKISTATGGDVTASYDPATDKISLTSASGSLMLGAANDTSNFLTSMRLSNNGTGTISSASSLGATNASATLATAGLRSAITNVDASGNGSFSVNGVSIDYNVDTDTLSTVLARITASSAGVTASYDAANDKVVLTNKTTGDTDISISEGAGGLVEALGLGSASTLTRGQNALFTVNDGPTLVSTTNTLDSSVHGIEGLTITARSASTETISVTADTESMQTAIEDFITAYNNVQDYIDSVTKISTTDGEVTAEALAGNREVQEWSSKLRSIVFGSVSGLTGSITRLNDLGIDFISNTDKLAIKDQTKLTKALNDNASDVATLFGSASTDGVVSKLNKLITTIAGESGDGGILKTQRDALTKANTSLDAQIEVLERRVEQQRELLEAAFQRMNEYQTKMDSTSKLLDQLYNSSSKDDS